MHLHSTATEMLRCGQWQQQQKNTRMAYFMVRFGSGIILMPETSTVMEKKWWNRRAGSYTT